MNRGNPNCIHYNSYDGYCKLYSNNEVSRYPNCWWRRGYPCKHQGSALDDKST